MENSTALIESAQTTVEPTLEPDPFPATTDSPADSRALKQYDQQLLESATIETNGLKRKRTPTPDEDPTAELHKRAKTSPPPSVLGVPETPPLSRENTLPTPKASDGENSEMYDGLPPIDPSARSPEVANTSCGSSETFDEDKTAEAMEDVIQAENVSAVNDGTSAAMNAASLPHSDQQSVAETTTSGNDAAPEQQPPQVLSSPSISPLSTPPSSPTLDAQKRYVSASMEEHTRVAGVEPSALELDAGELGQDANGIDTEMADSSAAADRASVQQDGSASSSDDQAPVAATPLSRTQPVQLPTPASSNPSPSGSFLFPGVDFSKRVRRPPKWYADLVETPATPEETDAEPESMVVVLPIKKTPAKKAPAASKARKSATKAKAPGVPKAAVKTSAAPKGRVTKSKKADTSSETLESAAKPRGRPRKQPQKKPNVPSDEEIVVVSSNDITLPTTTKAKTRGSGAATVPVAAETVTTSKVRKNSKTGTEPKPKPAKPAKKTASTLISLVRTERPPIIVDAAKLKLSGKLSKREPLESKPDPQSQPRVWAESRQALCETLPYFKKPQGGCYSNEGHVYGFLFDGVGHCREYLNENLILCRAGGSMEADSINGGMIQKKDQSMTESQVLSVLNDMKHHNPLIVICGNRNVAAPAKMPHQYNVLGWYKPVYIWAEKTEGKGTKIWTTIKYRLERLNQHLEPAWHSPKDDTRLVSDEERAIAGPMFTKNCEQCHLDFPQIYLQGWMCLNPGCDVFWQLPDEEDAPYGAKGLDYDPAFLLHRYELWKDDTQEMEPVPTDVRPPVPKVGDIIGDNLYYVNTRGVCCPECGRCNSRRRFKGWVCESCGWKEYPKHNPVLPTMLHTPWDAAPTLVRNKHAEGVQIEIRHLYGYKVSIYTFKGIDGRFIHLAASKQLNEEDRAANAMFADIQTVDMGLERRVFAVSNMSGGRSEKPKDALQELLNDDEPSLDLAVSQEGVEPGEIGVDKTEEFAPGDLMTAFSMNYGMPYKFVASGGSQSFDDAPWPVTETRRRLNWAQKTFLSNQAEYMDFNEQLIFAYLEGQKIEYHDDGESGLGPRIATMSLGGRAKMHMRMKAKHYVGCSKTGIFTDERPVPWSIDGQEMYEKRLKHWEELQALKVSERAAYTKRRKELPKELGIFEKKMKKADDLVTVTLSHGDIIIMDGYNIQKYLEHKVVPEGYLRFALTCRTVLPDHLKPEELPSYKVEVDPITYDGPKLSEAPYKE